MWRSTWVQRVRLPAGWPGSMISRFRLPEAFARVPGCSGTRHPEHRGRRVPVPLERERGDTSHRMKILILCRSLDVGGAERQIVELAKGLRQRGHEVSVAVFYGGGPLEADLGTAGIQMHDLRKTGRWDIAGFAARLLRLLRAERPDVLHSYLTLPNLLATATRPLPTYTNTPTPQPSDTPPPPPTSTPAPPPTSTPDDDNDNDNDNDKDNENENDNDNDNENENDNNNGSGDSNDNDD